MDRPDIFVPREELEALVKLLLSSTTVAVCAVQGMGGIGKSVLASEAVRDPRIQQHFHSIYWMNIGSELTPRQFLFRTAGVPQELEPDVREKVLRKCGGLPLALYIVGMAVHDRSDQLTSSPWSDALLLLEKHDIGQRSDIPGYSQSLFSSLGSSATIFQRDEPGLLDCWLELVIFREDIWIPECVIRLLWQYQRSPTIHDVREWLGKLVNKALLEKKTRMGGELYRLHDVIRSYQKWRLGPESIKLKHLQLISAAKAKLHTAGDWTSMPPELFPYFLEHLEWHLGSGGLTPFSLLTECKTSDQLLRVMDSCIAAACTATGSLKLRLLALLDTMLYQHNHWGSSVDDALCQYVHAVLKHCSLDAAQRLFSMPAKRFMDGESCFVLSSAIANDYQELTRLLYQKLGPQALTSIEPGLIMERAGSEMIPLLQKLGYGRWNEAKPAVIVTLLQKGRYKVVQALKRAGYRRWPEVIDLIDPAAVVKEHSSIALLTELLTLLADIGCQQVDGIPPAIILAVIARDEPGYHGFQPVAPVFERSVRLQLMKLLDGFRYQRWNELGPEVVLGACHGDKLVTLLGKRYGRWTEIDPVLVAEYMRTDDHRILRILARVGYLRWSEVFQATDQRVLKKLLLGETELSSILQAHYSLWPGADPKLVSRIEWAAGAKK